MKAYIAAYTCVNWLNELLIERNCYLEHPFINIIPNNKLKFLIFFLSIYERQLGKGIMTQRVTKMDLDRGATASNGRQWEFLN